MAAPRLKSSRRPGSSPVSAGRQARLVLPTSAQELVPVRAIGSGSSSTRCTEALGGTSVDLSEMNRVLRIGHDSVTVQPGITLAELADILDARGLELIGGFDFANRTVGGAVSASGLEALGAGDASSFAANVLQVKFVTADGRKGCVNADTQTMLRLFRLSYGLLGIAYEITLRVRPIQSFNVRSIRIDVADIENLLVQLAHTRASARLRLFPFRRAVHCELRETAAGSGTGARLAWRLKSWTANSALPAAAFALAKAMPVGRLRYGIVDSLGETTMNLSTLGPLKTGSGATEQLTRTNIFGNSPIEHTSWAFPQRGFATTAAAWFDFCRQHYERTGFRCDPPAVALPSPRDSGALLSPSFDQPIVTLTAVNNPVDGWNDFAFEFAEFATDHGGIPLFGQSLHASAANVKSAYDKRWTAFCKTRAQLDPEKRLVNSFFQAFITE
ncbi:MAG: FAD-binding oxidoreductase [Gammaproteobacteria bacterium]